jgi:hypothetical protein
MHIKNYFHGCLSKTAVYLHTKTPHVNPREFHGHVNQVKIDDHTAPGMLTSKSKDKIKTAEEPQMLTFFGVERNSIGKNLVYHHLSSEIFSEIM